MSERSRTLYTDKDIKVIKKHVNNHPENLKKAFKLASEELGTHSFKSILTSYYHKNSKVALALSEEITLMSKKKVMRGRKNTSSIVRPKQILKKKINQILDILFDD